MRWSIPRDGDRFHLVEQFRYPLGMRRWEFPQGTAPGHEESDPIELANRELREETGLRADSMELLGTLDVAPGMSSQRGRVFLATGITEGEHDREHEEQDMHSDWFSRAQLERMIRDGDICDAQTVAAWALLTAGRALVENRGPANPLPRGQLGFRTVERVPDRVDGVVAQRQP